VASPLVIVMVPSRGTATTVLSAMGVSPYCRGMK
jgi:hypothetical protein